MSAALKTETIHHGTGSNQFMDISHPTQLMDTSTPNTTAGHNSIIAPGTRYLVEDNTQGTTAVDTHAQYSSTGRAVKRSSLAWIVLPHSNSPRAGQITDSSYISYSS